jgi:hypothetical protein
VVRDPYARWCGRGGTARCPPIPIIGATSPLPCVPAKVPSTSDLQTFAIVRCNPVVCWLDDLTPWQAARADVAGYSRLMGADEEGTHERLRTPENRGGDRSIVRGHQLLFPGSFNRRRHRVVADVIISLSPDSETRRSYACRARAGSRTPRRWALCR